jgi:hypothetical protein
VTEVKDLDSAETNSSRGPAVREAGAQNPALANRSMHGFRAHLQGVSLHDLVMLQNLVRASGVFVILSGEHSGSLHFSRGQLFHAESGDLSGDAAALEILSWHEGEFLNSERAPAERPSITASLDNLLLRLEQSTEDSRYSEPPATSATGIRRRMDGPGAIITGVPIAASSFDGAPESTRNLAAAATPGTAAQAPRFATRAGETRGVTNVLVTPRGQLVDGNGVDTEALASRVAYVARLAELIGQAMGSGETRSLKVRAASTEMCIRRHADGHISGSLGPPEVGLDSAPPSTPTFTQTSGLPAPKFSRNT